MMTTHIGGYKVTGYDHSVHNSLGGIFHIEHDPAVEGWSLRYSDPSNRVVLNDPNHAPVIFDTPEQVVDYIKNATPTDPAWNDFVQRINPDHFVFDLDNEQAWSPRADLSHVLID